VFLSKDLISVLLIEVYLYWNTIVLWVAARHGKIFVDFRYDILSRDAFCDPITASMSYGFMLMSMVVTLNITNQQMHVYV
jgi:hypothetical protein